MEQLYPVRRQVAEPLSIYDQLDLPVGREGRPFVAVNMVSTVDGKITLNKKERAEPIGSPVDRALMKRLRLHFDAVLRGAETVRANPFFPGVPDELVPLRERAGMSPQPLGIVVSRSLDLPWESQYFSTSPKPVILTTAASDPKRREIAGRYARVEIAGDEEVDAGQALELLYHQYGIRRLLVEGGAALNYTFVKGGWVDTLFWTLAPKLSGFKEDLTMISGPALLSPVPRLRLETLYLHQEELYFRWSLNETGLA